MNDEELLWELAGMEPHEVTEAGTAGAVRELPVSVLEEYRSGQLPVRESERVEAALIASRSERRRLEALAGIRILAPASVRRRLFGHDAGSLARASRRRLAWRAAPWRIAAAASIGLLALLVFWQAVQRDLLPWNLRGAAARPLPEYRIEITGAASLRSLSGTSGAAGSSGEAAGSSPEALPDTVVRLAVLPETAPSTVVELGVYRREGEYLLLVPSEEILSFESQRGAWTLELTARSLVGESRGVHSFYLAVTEPGQLRDTVSVTGAADPVVALRAACGGRVFERNLTIVDREPEDEPH